MLARALAALVRGYRRWLSPLKGRPTCRFLPTCSEYAHEALMTQGVWRGGAKAAWRILRCNPLFKGGYDPVCGQPHFDLVDVEKKHDGRHR